MKSKNVLSTLLLWTTIVPVAIVVALIIATVLGLPSFEGIWQVVFALVLISVASALSSYSAALVEQGGIKRVVAVVAMCLLFAALIFAEISVFGLVEGNFVTNLALSLGIFAVLFCLASANALRLGKKLIVLQAVTYVLCAYVAVVAALAIFGVSVMAEHVQSAVFVIVAVLAVLGTIVLSAIGKRSEIASSDKTSKRVGRADRATEKVSEKTA